MYTETRLDLIPCQHLEVLDPLLELPTQVERHLHRAKILGTGQLQAATLLQAAALTRNFQCPCHQLQVVLRGLTLVQFQGFQYPARAGNDAGRINRALEPLLQAAGGNESQNNAAAERFPGQILEHLNNLSNILERQQALNERLEQRIMAVEEQSQNGREKKTTKCLPKALTVRYVVYEKR